MSAKYKDFFEIPSQSKPTSSPSVPSQYQDFFNVQSTPEPEQPSFLEETKRHTLRTGARVAEELIGLPGNIIQAPITAAKFLKEKISGEKHPEFDEVKFPLPTSQDVRGVTKKLTGEYLEPQTPGEEFSDRIVSDFASLFSPEKGKVIKSLLRPFAISVGSNLVEKGVERAGGTEGQQSASKFGSLFLLSMLKPGGAKDYGNQLYKESKALIPSGASLPSQNISAAARRLEQELKKGGTAPYKTAALTKVNEIQSKIKNGRIPVDELTQFKVDINNARSSLYADQALDKPGRAMAKRNLDSAAKVVDDALKEYGHINPEWAAKYRPANEVFGAIQQSQKVRNNVLNFVKKHPHLATGGLAAELFLAPGAVTGVGSAVGALGLAGGELMARIAKSPTLRKYYGGVVKAAINDDYRLFNKEINKLDAALKREED